MALFSASFTGVAVANSQDLFELVAPASSRVLIHQIELGQYSEFGDDDDELLSIQLIRGHATSGSTGTSATHANGRLANFESWGRDAASTVETNNTTLASSGTAVTHYSTAFNIRAGFYWPSSSLAGLKKPIALETGDRFVVRTPAPTPLGTITMNGTLVFEEIGKLPS